MTTLLTLPYLCWYTAILACKARSTEYIPPYPYETSIAITGTGYNPIHRTHLKRVLPWDQIDLNHMTTYLHLQHIRPSTTHSPTQRPKDLRNLPRRISRPLQNPLPLAGILRKDDPNRLHIRKPCHGTSCSFCKARIWNCEIQSCRRWVDSARTIIPKSTMIKLNKDILYPPL